MFPAVQSLEVRSQKAVNLVGWGWTLGVSKVWMVRGSGHTSLAKRSLGRGERRRLNTGLMLCEGEARRVWLRDVSAVTLSTPVPQLMSLDQTAQGEKATEPPHNLLSGSVDSIKQSDLFFKRLKSCCKISLSPGIQTFSERAEPLRATGH